MIAIRRAKAFKARLAISATLLGPQYVGKRLTPHAPFVIRLEKLDRNLFVWTIWKTPQPVSISAGVRAVGFGCG